MSEEYQKVWVCDYEDCGHKWWKNKKTKPARCAGCKRSNWNQKNSDPKLPAAKVKTVPKSEIVPEARAVEKPTPTPAPEPPKPKPIVIDRGHNKSTCRIYGCLLCGVK